MPAEIYEIAALAARFWFLFLMVMIVMHSYRWYARDRRLRKKRLKDLPDAGYIGEFVVMESTGDLKQGDVLAVPFEGTLGMLLNNDVCVGAEGVAPRHLWFRYDRERGIRMLPLDDNEFTVDQTSIVDQPEGLYVVHGSRLYVGACQLRLRMFEGYEVRQAPQPAPARAGSPWPDQLLGTPVFGQVGLSPEGSYGPGEPEGMQPEQPEGLLPDRWRENPYAQPSQAEPSPYGQRVRSRFTAARSLQQEAAAGKANPFRSRSSIPGLAGSRVYRSTGGSLLHAARTAPEEIPAAAEAAPETAAPVAPEKAAPVSSFSAMSEYAKLMAQAANGEVPAAVPEAKPVQPVSVETKQPAEKAQSVQPVRSDVEKNTAVKPQAASIPVRKPQAAEKAQPIRSEAEKTAAVKPQPASVPVRKPQPAVKPQPVQPVRSEGAKAAVSAPQSPAARPAQKPLPPTVRPVSLEGIHITPTFAPTAPQDMVFEDTVPDEASLAPEEVVFHPLMDDDDWEEWESEPLPEEQPLPGNAGKMSGTGKTPGTVHQQEEEWPYLARPDQWQSEGLFADLLDEDGTDAALPRSAYAASEQAGNTTRRMLNRYFKGGGM